jgi:pimeloyl-ACP methyl ester carboxylesterase
VDIAIMGWIAVAGLGLAAALGASVVALFPPLPRDLGGAPDLDAEAERVRIPVPGDGELNAWVIPGSRLAVIVLFHGFGRTHHRAWRYAGFLRHLGAHLVTVDFRSSRTWGRRPTTLGLHELEDAATVLDWVVRSPRFAGCSIGIHGESLGAAVALDLAARRPEVAAVVADAAFASASKAIEDSCERWARVPREPSATILRTLGRVVTGYDPGTFAPVEALSALANRPVFFIHGTRDDRVGTEQAWALWRAAGAKDRLWIVAGAGHNEAWRYERSEYERCVSAFFARGLLGDAAPA